MEDQRIDMLLRSLDGDATPEEQERLSRDAALKAERDALGKTRGLLRSVVRRSAQEALKPFLAQRVLRHIAPEAADEAFAHWLGWLFPRVAVAWLLVVIALSLFNFSGEPRYEGPQSVVEVAFALPPVSIDDAFELDLPSESATDLP